MSSPVLTMGIVGGAGTLGSTMAFYLASRDVLNEVVLIDLKQNLLRAHIMDMEQAMVPVSATRVSFGKFEDLARCRIVIVAASVHELHATDRLRFLRANIPVVASIAEHIRAVCPDAIVINATNPVDVLNYILWRRTGLPRERLLGFSSNDTVRFRWALAQVLGVSAARIHGLVVGEHGPGQVLLFSSVKVDGAPVDLTSAQRSRVTQLVGSWFERYTALKSGRTSGWTSAVSAWAVVSGLLRGTAEPIALSVVPNGEYGLRDISIGLPLMLSSDGVSSIVDLKLDDEEEAALTEAAAKIKGLIRENVD